METMTEQIKQRFDRLSIEKQTVIFERFGGDCWEDIAEEVTNMALFHGWKFVS